MVMGRPREHDRAKIAQELVEWARLEDSINLNKFCAYREPPIPVTKLLEWSKECDDFRMAYETAKAFIAYRREENLSNNKLHVKAYDLNATNYDLLLRAEKREEQRYEASLKKEFDKPTTTVIINDPCAKPVSDNLTT